MEQISNREREKNVRPTAKKRNPYLAEYKKNEITVKKNTIKRKENSSYQKKDWHNRKKAVLEKKEKSYPKTITHKKIVLNSANRRRRRKSKSEIRRIRRNILILRRLIVLAVGVCCILFIVNILFRFGGKTEEDSTVVWKIQSENALLSNILEEKIQGIPISDYEKHPVWEENFLTPNEYSRPGDRLTEIKNIFVHYTANQGTSAAQNRSYFEQLKDTKERSASAHFIIGYEGEIIQCIPLDEIAYAVQTRNQDSVSIECCYLAEDGSFTQETYDSLISLLAWLIDVYDLDSEDILRHYDCGGKRCPLYYTEHEDAWEALKRDVKDL